jgi:MFS family permease
VIVGIVMFALTPWFALVPVALVFWGIGSALGVPIGFTAAAEEPKRAAARVAAVSSFATVAGLAIPPVIGHLAEATSTRHALLIVVLAAIATLALARSVRREERIFGRLRRRRRRPQLEAAETALSVAPSDTGTTLGA